MELGTVKNRDKLKPQREPFWQRLAAGQFLGFRPSSIGKGGTWIARFYDEETTKYRLSSLGDFGHLPPNERFTAAAKEARIWFEHLGGGGSHKTTRKPQAVSSGTSTGMTLPRWHCQN